MAKLNIFGDSVTVVSGLKKAEIEVLKKFKPKALKLVDQETKDELFAMNFNPTSGSFSGHGVVFNSVNTAGNATLTIQIPNGMDAAKKAEYVKDAYGYALLSLNKLEDQVQAILADTEDEFAVMQDSIKVLGEE